LSRDVRRPLARLEPHADVRVEATVGELGSRCAGAWIARTWAGPFPSGCSAGELLDYFVAQVRKAFAVLPIVACMLYLVILVGLASSLATRCSRRRSSQSSARSLRGRMARRVVVLESLVIGCVGLALAAVGGSSWRRCGCGGRSSCSSAGPGRPGPHPRAARNRGCHPGRVLRSIPGAGSTCGIPFSGGRVAVRMSRSEGSRSWQFSTRSLPVGASHEVGLDETIAFLDRARAGHAPPASRRTLEASGNRTRSRAAARRPGAAPRCERAKRPYREHATALGERRSARWRRETRRRGPRHDRDSPPAPVGPHRRSRRS
jgi:hypothetical protein